MGLDYVEIVLRTEEFFAITIGDDEAGAIRTVGDFYKLICAKLDVISFDSPATSTKLPTVTEKKKTLLFLYKHTPLPPPSEVLPWSPQSVWDSLVAIVSDQQGLDPKEIHYHDRFAEDLGVD
jgi:acyl carrier protein